MRTSRWSPLLAAAALLAAACVGPMSVAEHAEPSAMLTLDGEPIVLTLTSCALVNGRLLAALPDGGTETTLTATGRLEDGRPVAVTVRRGTDELPPERFELVEVTVGEVERAIESLVAFRGRDASTDAWIEVDPDSPAARRTVADGLIEVDGPRLQLAATVTSPSDGRRVDLRLEASCPSALEEAPGTA